MIYVDELASWEAPWMGGVSCHMLSDESEEELLSFASSIGIPRAWFQPRSTPHFDLSPSWRRRAIAGGAVTVDKRGFVAAIHRFRERNGIAQRA